MKIEIYTQHMTEHGEMNNTCSICFDNDKDVIQLHCLCDIQYCMDCITKWFHSMDRKICPICKAETDLNTEYRVEILYDGYRYRPLNDDYVIILTNFKVINQENIKCYSDNDLIHDVIENFIWKIIHSVNAKSNIADCEGEFTNIIRILPCEGLAQLTFEAPCEGLAPEANPLIIKLAYIDFDIVIQKYYPIFETFKFP